VSVLSAAVLWIEVAVGVMVVVFVELLPEAMVFPDATALPESL
jgi:hypothetical protein